MILGTIVNRNGEDITEKVKSGEYVLSKEASECVERILSRIRQTDMNGESEASKTA